MTEPNVIGERIKYTRLERGLTQADVAAQTKLSRATVARCERDGEYAVRRGHVPAIAAALRVDPSYLVEPDVSPDEPATYELDMFDLFGKDPSIRAFARFQRALTDDERTTLHGILKQYKRKLMLEYHPNWDEKMAIREALDAFQNETGLAAVFVNDPVAAKLEF